MTAARDTEQRSVHVASPMYVAYRSGGVAPYLVSTCSCDWVGKAIDVDESNIRAAYDAVIAEARAHGAEVDPVTTWPLDAPPAEWRPLLAPNVAERPRRPGTFWRDARGAARPIAIVLSTIVLLILWLVKGPDLLDDAAVRLDPRVRIVPLALITLALFVLAVRATVGVYTRKYRAPDIYRGSLQRFMSRPAVIRVWAPAFALILAWYAALFTLDLTQPPATLIASVRTYCSGDTRTFAIPGRTLTYAWGSRMPCVIPPGRYRLSLAAATNFVIAYERVP